VAAGLCRSFFDTQPGCKLPDHGPLSVIKKERTMRVTHATIAAALAFVALVPRPAAAQAPLPPPLIKPEGLRQISPRVHIIPDNSVPAVPNVGIVVGDRAVLVIDTGLGPRNGAAVEQVAKRLGGDKTQYVVITHFHPEHDLGASAFPATAKLIRSTDQIKDIEEFGLQLAKVFATRSGVHADLLKDADFRKADITFEKDYELDLGVVKVRLIAMGPNHTRGDIAMWVESERVLFSGDVAMRAQPAFASPYSAIRHWLASLDRLEALKPAIIVPAHGPTGDAALITGYRAYLTEVRDRTAAEKSAGRDVDAAVATVAAAMADRYRDRARLAGAIRVAFKETP
jgi:glyoxylase-like metal-dependent hydrolase (beta-lactamase superfamily II)